MRRTRFITAAMALSLMAACETTNIAPATAPTTQLESDERRLWSRAHDEEELLEHSGFLARAPELEHYVEGIVATLKPDLLPNGATIHVRILVDPSLNAFALPDGTLYIHTGLLARLENEAQLAVVVGHEITHAVHRHALKGFRDLKNKTAFAAVFNAGTAGVGGILGALGAASSVSGYAKDLERDADVTGFQLLTRAGYDPREAIKVFELLLQESRRSKIREPFFFGSHPRLTERISSYQQLVAALPPGRPTGRVERERYGAHIAEILLPNGIAAQQAGDLDFAQESAERMLALQPGDPHALLLIADVQRKRGHDDDALRRYQEITRLDPAFADAFRGLGLVLFKQHRLPEAAQAFQRFITLVPEAPDRAYIESFLQQCETQS
jgi:predicted Zn-dependent protease